MLHQSLLRRCISEFSLRSNTKVKGESLKNSICWIYWHCKITPQYTSLGRHYCSSWHPTTKCESKENVIITLCMTLLLSQATPPLSPTVRIRWRTFLRSNAMRAEHVSHWPSDGWNCFSLERCLMAAIMVQLIAGFFTFGSVSLKLNSEFKVPKLWTLSSA